MLYFALVYIYIYIYIYVKKCIVSTKIYPEILITVLIVLGTEVMALRHFILFHAACLVWLNKILNRKLSLPIRVRLKSVIFYKQINKKEYAQLLP